MRDQLITVCLTVGMGGAASLNHRSKTKILF